MNRVGRFLLAVAKDILWALGAVAVAVAVRCLAVTAPPISRFLDRHPTFPAFLLGGLLAVLLFIHLVTRWLEAE